MLVHGDNQVWDHDELRLVVGFENIGATEPEYELRAFPGPGMGPGLELLTALIRHYQQLTGRQLSADRMMAWHLRQALGDVLWRSPSRSDHRLRHSVRLQPCPEMRPVIPVMSQLQVKT